jgi:glucose/arabinose dehydrogenase
MTFRARASALLPVFLAVSIACFVTPLARAATLPPGFAEVRIAQGLDPTALALAPDGRLFLNEKAGRIRVVKNDVLLSTPFATVATDASNEQGLQGIALDPDFASNGYVYVFYTVPGPNPHNRVSRFTAAGDVAIGGERVLFELSPRSSGVHNGGSLAFGPDRKLYVSTGDDQNSDHAQSTSTFHGKILRLNADGSTPNDNPMPSLPPPFNAIWALGLRNPFQMTFQPGTGRLYINDVGNSSWEEINEGAPNANFGWPAVEGMRDGRTVPPNYRDPVFAYSHDEGCSVTAGAFYNPPSAVFPVEYVGRYFFADYCGGYIKTFVPGSGALATFATDINRPLVIQVANDGSLYYIARGGIGGGSPEDNAASSSGELYRVRYTANQAPTISAQPQHQTVPLWQRATFVVGVSGSAPISYEWQRDNVTIPGATSASLSVTPSSLAESGASFRVVVRNAFGAITSNSAVLTVVDSKPPTPFISTPAVGSLYTAGSVLSVSGGAFDARWSRLPASALTWWIDFHHDEHFHPALAPSSGSSAISYQIPTIGETSSNVWYRIHLRATDSLGLARTISRDVAARKSTLTLRTVPAGLGVLLDGQPVSTPVAIFGVVGLVRTIAAPAQTLGTTEYVFSGWSDGGALSHSISTPASATSYVATFQAISAGAGSGLHGEYFNDMSLSGSPALTRDEAVNFDWGEAAPAPGVAPDFFSARWTGALEAPVTGSYTFSTVSDDGVRLWIDGRLVIDNWTDHPSTEDVSEPITLAAGRRYPVRLEFYENDGGAEVRLRWSYLGGPTTPIPASRLFADDGS